MTAWGWVRAAGNVAMGVIIFLTLRFLAAGVLGLYPIDTYGAINDAGGLYGILPGHDVSKVIMWEVVFAMVAEHIMVMWVKGTHKLPVRVVIVTSLLVLGLQIAVPDYTNTWASRSDVSTTLEHNGVVGAAAKGTWVFLFGKPTPKPTATPLSAPAPTHASRPPIVTATTPASIRADYHFRIEADGPIWVQYPGEKPVLFTPGKGFQQLPQPREPGEKVFTASNGGHVGFRLYPAD